MQMHQRPYVSLERALEQGQAFLNCSELKHGTQLVSTIQNVVSKGDRSLAFISQASINKSFKIV